MGRHSDSSTSDVRDLSPLASSIGIITGVVQKCPIAKGCDLCFVTLFLV